MLLAIDAGNTNIVFAVCERGEAERVAADALLRYRKRTRFEPTAFVDALLN